jgi:hypothetical protein
VQLISMALLINEQLVANLCVARKTIKLLKVKSKEIISSFSSLIGYVLFIYYYL